MNEHDGLDENKITDIENQAITDTATRWNISKKLVEKIMQYYTEKMENFEHFLNERYPDDMMNTQPYVVMEINNKVTREIADKHNMDQEIVRMIIRDYIEMVYDGIERERLRESD